jgi:hypothetical protein
MNFLTLFTLLLYKSKWGLVALVGMLLIFSSMAFLPATAKANLDRNLCQPDTTRVKIPDKFPLSACFDGSTVFVVNNLNFPVIVTVLGDSIGDGQRTPTLSSELPSAALATLALKQPNIVPPGYQYSMQIGHGKSVVQLSNGGADLAKSYVLTKLLWKYAPGASIQKTGVDLVSELLDVGNQYMSCLANNNGWRNFVCRPRLIHNVGFALTRAGIDTALSANGVSNLLYAIVDLTISSNSVVRDALKARNGVNHFTINAAFMPAASNKTDGKSNSQPSKKKLPSASDSVTTKGSGSSTPQPISPSTDSKPVAIARGSDTMDVFYRDTSNNLINIGWNSSTGWNVPTVRATNLNSNPVAIARSTTDMDVFYVDSNGSLMNIGWNASTGWGLPSQLSSGVASDPVVIARSPTDMDVFFRDINNNLQNVGWSAANGWVGAIQRVTGSVVGNPTAVARDSSNMDVFYRDSSNNLQNLGWNSTIGWSAPLIRSTGDVTGDPYVITRSPVDMDVFYKGNDGSTQNSLRTVGWNGYVGWNSPSTKSFGDVSGDPSAVGRDETDMDVFYKDFNGNLRNVGWNATSGWNSPTTRASGGVAGNPFVLSRDPVDMDVFYKDTSSNLVNVGWNATNGWYAPTTRAGGVY